MSTEGGFHSEETLQESLNHPNMTLGNLAFKTNDCSAARLGAGIAGEAPHREDVVAQESNMASRDEPAGGFPTADKVSSETLTLTRHSTHNGFEERRRDNEVHELARRPTTQYFRGLDEKNPFEAKPNSILDPNSPNFKPRAFAKSLLNL